MIEIKPFKGILYNEKKVGDIEKVVTPPYDVIDEVGQRQFSEMSEYNSVRLILSQKLPGDDDRENKYERAARTFKKWRDKGVLLQDEEESIYLYEEEFKDTKGEIRHRRGFIALLKLEEFGKGNIFPHEETMSKPKEDRLKLTRACNANFSQVFGLYSTSSPADVQELFENTLKEEPRISVTDQDGVVHRLWSISSREIITELQEEMSKGKIYIADGHHRYETALNYRNERRKATGDFTGNAPFDYVMMMFVSLDDPGLVVFPFHRVVKEFPLEKLEALEESLSPYFSVKKYQYPSGKESEGCTQLLQEMEQLGRSSHAFGAYIGDGTYYLFTLKADDDESISKLVEGNMSLEQKSLDVTILHSVIFKKLLNVNQDDDNIEYLRDEHKIIPMVDSGDYKVAFFLNPTKVDDVSGIAEKGGKMPKKSTYFYPKLYTGLVFRSIE